MSKSIPCYIDKDRIGLSHDKWLELRYNEEYCIHRVEIVNGIRLFLLRWVGLVETWWMYEEWNLLEKKLIDSDWWRFDNLNETTSLDFVNQFEESVSQYKLKNKISTQFEEMELPNPELKGSYLSKQLNKYKCPVCSSGMYQKTGVYGVFYSCKNWPDCKATLGANGKPSKKTKELIFQKKGYEKKQNLGSLPIKSILSSPGKYYEEPVVQFSVESQELTDLVKEANIKIENEIIKKLDDLSSQGYIETKIDLNKLISNDPVFQVLGGEEKKKSKQKKINFSDDDIGERFSGILKNKKQEGKDE